jgi:hypothetical protein
VGKASNKKVDRKVDPPKIVPIRDEDNPILGTGVHTRCVRHYQEDDHRICQLTLTISPLPTSVSMEMYHYMKDSISRFLTEKNITSGQVEDLPVVAAGGYTQ